MTELSQLLREYFGYIPDKNQVFDHNLQKFYDSRGTRIERVVSAKFKITARVGHFWQYPKRGIEMVEYCSDVKINRDSDTPCKSSLHFMPDCNYMYYGCYLNVCAFLMGVVPDRMILYCGPDNNNKYTFKYREEISKIILGDRYRELMKSVGQENYDTNQKLIFV